MIIFRMVVVHLVEEAVVHLVVVVVAHSVVEVAGHSELHVAPVVEPSDHLLLLHLVKARWPAHSIQTIRLLPV